MDDGSTGRHPIALRTDGVLGDLPLRYTEALLDADRDAATHLVLAAVEAGAPIREVYLEVFQASQIEIGRLWQTNRVSVAQEHFCTAVTQMVMSRLYDRIFSSERVGRRLVATCVPGELHELGVRIVSDFFEMEGWDTDYLGAGKPIPSVVSAVADRKADVLAISASLASNARQVADLIEAVRACDACRGVLVLAGGRPFNAAPDLWKRMGADGGAADAPGAVDFVKQRLRAAPQP